MGASRGAPCGREVGIYFLLSGSTARRRLFSHGLKSVVGFFFTKSKQVEHRRTEIVKIVAQ